MSNHHVYNGVTKDTFIEAWKKINLVRSDASLLKWLSSITVYKTLDAFRNKNFYIRDSHTTGL